MTVKNPNICMLIFDMEATQIIGSEYRALKPNCQSLNSNSVTY